MNTVPVLPPPHHAQAAGGTEITFIPHAAAIVYAGLLIALLAILLWREHVAFVKGCTCQKDRGTFLKPRWKSYNRKDR